MQNERESLPTHNFIAGDLSGVVYAIAGNVFRAYYDDAHQLVFVLDDTVDNLKTNALLVIGGAGDRKWDDILANDYNVDLEDVRPKRDNKYQKLDIEYDGLNLYADLIAQYHAGNNLDDAISKLVAFRRASVRKAATERLRVADETASRARETIARTSDSVAEMQSKIKDLRGKLVAQRKSIGREPTKQSAAKILRSESQIDAINEKMHRAKKRLDNAQRRLIIAEEDARAARDVLAAMDNITGNIHTGEIMVAPNTDITVHMDAPVPTVAGSGNKTNPTEPKAETMADEEVKPLFDTDPEILDEEIAFKPIDFGPTPTAVPVSENPTPASAPAAPMPLSFAPPASEYTAATASDNTNVATEPVLDTIRPVEIPNNIYTQNNEYETVASEFVTPTQNDIVVEMDTTTQRAPDYAAAPVVDIPQPQPQIQPQNPTPMPEISVAPTTSEYRPVSPISGTPVAPVDTHKQKPTLMYYIMLILLIVLSIFTLWIYQRSTSDNIPELTSTTAPAAETEPAPTATSDTDSPFIDMRETVTTVSVPEPTLVIEPEPEPAVIEPIAEPKPEPIIEPEPTPVKVETPFIDDTPVAEPEPVQQPSTAMELLAPIANSVVEPIVNKPAYNVSQQEKMFVAAPDYETDAPAAEPEPQYYDYAEPEIIQPAPDEQQACADGGAPDMNGCCTGEVFTDMEDGTFACCDAQGVECFPPMM